MFEKIVSQTHGSALPRDNDKDLITMHHSTTDCKYAGIRYLYDISGLEGPPNLLGDTVTAGIYVCETKS